MASLFTSTSGSHRYADVVLPLALPQLLTYGIPTELQGSLVPGMRVEVGLGKNKQYAAIVVSLHSNTPESYEVKPIRALIDEVPVVSDIQLRFWEWIAEYYAAAPGEVMQAALPAHLKLSAETRLQWAPRHSLDRSKWSDAALPVVAVLEAKGAISITELRNLSGRKGLIAVLHELLHAEAVIINDALEPTYRRKTEKVLSLAPEYATEPALHALFDSLARAPRQLEALMVFMTHAQKSGPEIKAATLLADGKVSAGAIKALEERGVLIAEEQDVDRIRPRDGGEVASEVSLSTAQGEAYESVENGLKEKGVVLLQGVTGSGKTLLYIQKIRDCIAAGQQALLLLPEIGLTTQLVRRLYAYFGEELGVYHSRFSNNERVEIWEAVAQQKYKVVVGPRSAIWLPFQKLGIIICDEEHDPSYKQRDPAPRFHARDAAIYLAGLHGAGVILGSATPSVESLYNVRQGKYAYAALKERYRGVQLPKIEVVDARTIETGKSLPGAGILTPALREAVQAALTEQRQVILFQNRRGYAPFQICTVCGWVPECRNCAVSLTYHKSSDKMQCHYCGAATGVPAVCAQCGSNRLVSRSFGTEKIEEEVKKAFPEARVARMDIDSMRGRNALSQLLDSMEAQQTDILVGTQMVVKGLDFAPVALVAILSADALLTYPDFRVNERGFQLMEQVAGRSGRADGKGRVIIQAFNLQHPALQWVVDHDVGAFYRHEIGYREFFGYPPFSRMIRLIFRHRDEQKAADAANAMAEAIASLSSVTVQGPVAALVPRVRNQYVQEMLLKCPRDSRHLSEIKAFLKEQRQRVSAQKAWREVQIIIDVDPV